MKVNKFLEYIVNNELATYVEDVEISKHTTYKTGGVFKYFVEPYTVECLQKVVSYLKNNGIKYFVIGNGSNIIMPEGYNEVVVIKLTHLSNYTICDDYIEVDAGILMPKIALELAYLDISCFEFASGIPGTIGGCIYMNAGAYGSEIKDCIISALVYDASTNEIFEVDVADMNLTYRHSIFMSKPWIVLCAKFKYQVGNRDEIVTLINDRRRRRVNTQPVGLACAGSVFRNFDDLPVWKAIDECGLRGYSIGGASISDKHCNMIINNGDATSDDIIKLIEEMKRKVYEKFGRELVLEQKIIKWDD